MWVVSVAGGQPQRVAANFRTARHPIWHRDGKRLLISGYTSTNAFDESGIDWWVVSADSSNDVRTGAYEALVRTGLQPMAGTQVAVPAIPEPRCWASPGNRIVFSIPAGDSWNLWQLELSPQTGKVVGRPQRLTTGAGSDLRASCAIGGTLAFAKVETRTDVWLLPFDLDRGVSTGVPQQITQGPPWHENPSLAWNGRFLAFASDQSGRANIWLRELETGNEQIVAASPFTQRYPVSSPSGARIAFSVYEKDKRVVYMSAPGGAPEKLCEGCLRATDWSRDEKSVLVFAGDPYQISIVDLASRRQTPLVKHDDVDVPVRPFLARQSLDQFYGSRPSLPGPHRGGPCGGSRPDSRTYVDYGGRSWARRLRTLVARRKNAVLHRGKDGYSCLWAQRIDATTHQPVGEAFVVHHLHGRLSFDHGGWSAAAGRIAIPLVETTGNLWMMSRSR